MNPVPGQMGFWVYAKSMLVKTTSRLWLSITRLFLVYFSGVTLIQKLWRWG